MYTAFVFPEDTVVHEFAALGISNMATEFSSKASIFESGGVDALVKCLSSSDPDVQKNSVEALAQMLLVRELQITYFMYISCNCSSRDTCMDLFLTSYV